MQSPTPTPQPLLAACRSVLVLEAELRTCTTPAMAACVRESRDAAWRRAVSLAGSTDTAIDALTRVRIREGARIAAEYELGGAS